MVYICECCNYSTLRYYNYGKHIESKKHLLIIGRNTDNPKQPIDNPQTTQEKNNFSCKYCNQVFAFRQSMNRHIKYTCTKNKDEDLKELVRLLNNQLEEQKKEFTTKLETQSKQIEKLMGKLQIQNNFVNSNVIQNNNNIQLLAYKNTDISHLTKKDYINSIKKMNFCVKYLIEKVHFNPDKPENMNIYISNLKNKYIMIYDGQTWTAKDKKTEIDNLFLDKEMLLEQWLEEECYPELKDKFVKYLNNKEKDETLNMIKDEIKLMMYNNKSMIEN
jgi:hypothetical protein